MKKENRLIGCIEKLGNEIHTRYLYMDGETKEVKDVTYSLFVAIEKFNEKARIKRKRGVYSMVIPYDYYKGLVQYSFGCGLSHYLQESVFAELEQVSGGLDFPLSSCRISMYVPSDVKDILNVSGVFDERIFGALKERY